jgi:hypothetical protein
MGLWMTLAGGGGDDDDGIDHGECLFYKWVPVKLGPCTKRSLLALSHARKIGSGVLTRFFTQRPTCPTNVALHHRPIWTRS